MSFNNLIIQNCLHTDAPRPATFSRFLNNICGYFAEILLFGKICLEGGQDNGALLICCSKQSLIWQHEGAGAAGVAAIMAGKIKISSEERVCAVLCGGNIDGNVLARVIEQVLVRNGRYVIFKVLVPDRPGSLAGMLDIIAAERANVIEVYHQRAIWLAPIGIVGIETILEVRDAEHAKQVQRSLESAGLHVEHEHQSEW